MTQARAATTTASPRRRDQLPRGRKPGKRLDWRKGAEVVAFTLPALTLLALFIAWPIMKAVEFSFYRWKGFGPLVDFVGLQNYVSVLTNDVFTSSVGHNFFIVFVSIALQLPLGLAIALLLNQKIRGQGVLRTIVFVPYVVAEVIAGVVWYQLLQPKYGVFDSLMSSIGLQGPPQGWLGTQDYALWTVMIVLTWKYLGLAIILFLAGLQGVPDEVLEASAIDGASWWQTQRHITIPMLGPTLKTWVFLSMVGSLQLFDMVWILTKGGPANATTTMATFLINEGTKRSNYGIAGAASVILFIIALTCSVFYQRFVMRSDESRAAKRTTRKAGR
ncbi:carbohydrate ABC transporter permease [Tessaracoccus sp. OH4464_COT-324]|uniref:carbohydrate ABC transporter permease n=1 Tax=Tessaracoccus sp. OH4464_COT-324 TaxID=2491059 RepID=UPI000F637477|nr:sugar ABC transporter permease [Tessaracoccus sp. OH4464_COT-324]RRD46936.1 sugar ABC transporter permease [Tessaracoccus sp. OH4464_COT-324]